MVIIQHIPKDKFTSFRYKALKRGDWKNLEIIKVFCKGQLTIKQALLEKHSTTFENNLRNKFRVGISI